MDRTTTNRVPRCGLACALGAALLWAGAADAKSEYLRTVEAHYSAAGTRIATCILCHPRGAGSAPNRFGKTFFSLGANARALDRIGGDDADRDGFTNEEELVARTFPGDPRDVPATRPTPEEIAAARQGGRPARAATAPATDAGVLREIHELRRRLDQLEGSLGPSSAPAESFADGGREAEAAAGFEIDLGEEDDGEQGFAVDLDGEPGPARSGGGLLDSVVENFQWAGALDVWVRWVKDGESTSTHPLYNGKGTRTIDPLIHVAEVVATTKVGDNVTVLAEVLLPTEEGLNFRQLVAEKHGFFYAIFSNLPVLPRGSTLWLGRYRIPYGIDAVLDAPASPLDTLTTKITGQISDVALMWTGFKGPFEWSIAAADGADFNSVSVSDHGIPLYARTDADLSGLVPGLHVGISGFLGEQHRYVDGILRTPDAITGEDVVHKKRVTLHGQVPVGKLGLFGEATWGDDDGDGFRAFFARADYNVTPKLVGHLVWDYLKTDYRERDLAASPDPKLARLATDDFTGDAEQFLRFGVSYHLSEQIIVRLIDDLKLTGSDNHPDNVLTSQFLLEF